MSNFANYMAISDESHGAFFTNLVSKDFTPVADSDLISHQFIENFAIGYVERDEANLKRVIDYYRNYLTELFLKVEQRAAELVAGISISKGIFDATVTAACDFSQRAMSGHPDYVEYLLPKEPEPPEELGTTFIAIKTCIILVKGDENSPDDKVPRVLVMIDSELWQRHKDDPAMASRVGTIDEIKIN